jgi:hypothetical protein
MDRTARPAGAFRSGHSGVVSAEQVAVPAQDRIRTHQQSKFVQGVAGESVQKRGEQRPVGQSQPDPRATELALQYPDLVAQGQDLDVLSLSRIGSRRNTAKVLIRPR